MQHVKYLYIYGSKIHTFVILMKTENDGNLYRNDLLN